MSGIISLGILTSRLCVIVIYLATLHLCFVCVMSHLELLYFSCARVLDQGG